VSIGHETFADGLSMIRSMTRGSASRVRERRLLERPRRRGGERDGAVFFSLGPSPVSAFFSLGPSPVSALVVANLARMPIDRIPYHTARVDG
jgi:hypothetical protein